MYFFFKSNVWSMSIKWLVVSDMRSSTQPESRDEPSWWGPGGLIVASNTFVVGQHYALMDDLVAFGVSVWVILLHIMRRTVQCILSSPLPYPHRWHIINKHHGIWLAGKYDARQNTSAYLTRKHQQQLQVLSAFYTFLTISDHHKWDRIS